MRPCVRHQHRPQPHRQRQSARLTRQRQQCGGKRSDGIVEEPKVFQRAPGSYQHQRQQGRNRQVPCLTVFQQRHERPRGPPVAEGQPGRIGEQVNRRRQHAVSERGNGGPKPAPQQIPREKIQRHRSQRVSQPAHQVVSARHRQARDQPGQQGHAAGQQGRAGVVEGNAAVPQRIPGKVLLLEKAGQPDRGVFSTPAAQGKFGNQVRPQQSQVADEQQCGQ